MAIIPDVPEDIEIQLQRTEFITRKLIDKVGDDNNDDVNGKHDGEIVFESYPLDVGGEYKVHNHLFTEAMK